VQCSMCSACNMLGLPSAVQLVHASAMAVLSHDMNPQPGMAIMHANLRQHATTAPPQFKLLQRQFKALITSAPRGQVPQITSTQPHSMPVTLQSLSNPRHNQGHHLSCRKLLPELQAPSMKEPHSTAVQQPQVQPQGTHGGLTTWRPTSTITHHPHPCILRRLSAPHTNPQRGQPLPSRLHYWAIHKGVRVVI